MTPRGTYVWEDFFYEGGGQVGVEVGNTAAHAQHLPGLQEDSIDEGSGRPLDLSPRPALQETAGLCVVSEDLKLDPLG